MAGSSRTRKPSTGAWARASRSSPRSTGSIHDRNRAEALWDFFYRLEMYVPKAKRVHGYYVLPILRGDRLIGRIEPVFDRKTGVLRVNGVFAEPGAPASAGPGIAGAVRRLAKWLGAHEIVYSRRVPAMWRASCN